MISYIIQTFKDIVTTKQNNIHKEQQRPQNKLNKMNETPEIPKRPINGFMTFSSELCKNRKDAKDNADKDTPVAPKISTKDAWDNLSQEVRDDYNSSYKTRLVDYKACIEEFKTANPERYQEICDERAERIREQKKRKLDNKERSSKKKTRKKNIKAKYSGYLLFSNEKRKELKDSEEEDSKMSPKDIMKHLAAAWKGLEEDEQTKWNQEAKAQYDDWMSKQPASCVDDTEHSS